jgi:shikimate dehydrogenase
MSDVPTITGATRLFAIVGDPILQVRSPQVYTQAFAQRGIDALMIPAHAKPERFEQTIAGLMALGNLDGLLVTAPYKVAMLKFADTVGSRGQRVGAVNALRRMADGRWHADMFDGEGFVSALQKRGVPLRSARVLMFGCGGAGAAIAVSLADAGVAGIHFVDPNHAQAAPRVQALGAACPSCRMTLGPAGTDGIDIVINASTVGMRSGDGLPAPLDDLSSSVAVGDVVLSAGFTPLIAFAQSRGCPSVTGVDMHAGQTEALLAFLLEANAAQTR